MARPEPLPTPIGGAAPRERGRPARPGRRPARNHPPQARECSGGHDARAPGAGLRTPARVRPDPGRRFRGFSSQPAGRRRLLRLATQLATPLLAATVLALAPPSILAATASLSVDTRTIHAGMPFTLTLSARGFEEHPAPAAPELAVEGCTVTWLGVSPSVSTQITIVNGQRTEERDVTFNYRWRVLPATAGTYRLPPLTVEQGGVAATTPAATFQATEVPDTTDMIVRMRLPGDDVFVGETFDAAVEWLLAREVESYEFAVPLFELDGAEVEAAPGAGRKVPFAAGAGEVSLALERGREVVDGRQYTRFVFPARITLARSGVFDLDPVRVAARLQTGEERDRFGFRNPRYELFRAEGRPRRLMVRALPVSGRPASFVNAVGRGFSIEVAASRTIVSVGDPIDLTIRLRGDAPLEGLSLPPLDGPQGLPAALFGVPEGSVAGSVDAQTNSKVFEVTVRVRSDEAGEIPPIAFSWFDPRAREYRTARSRPIALSVERAELVGAREVVTAADSPLAESRREPSEGAAAAGTAPAATATLIGADMSLSSPAETLARPWGSGDIRIALGVLYGAPVLALPIAWWLARTRRRRTHRREVRSALRAVERALACGAPAREAAPAIIAAMRRLAEAAGVERAAAAAALEPLETRAFDPAVAGSRVAADLVEELRIAAHAWSRGARAGSTATVPVWVLAAVLAAVAVPGPGATDSTLSPGASNSAQSPVATDPALSPVATDLALSPVAADSALSPVATDSALSPEATDPALSPEATDLALSPEAADSARAAHAADSLLAEARALYAQSLGESVRADRVRRFAAAENAYRRLAAANPDAPRLQADWGNAALGAGDTGRAVLAWLRALRVMPDHERALANLAWVRGRMPEWLPAPAATGAWESLLYWRGRMTAAQLHLVGAAAFAAGVLALAGRLLAGQRALRALAVPLLAVWAIAAASAWTARPPAGEAVVMRDEVTLRSADSAGAAPAFGRPLPAGTEVTVVETRDAWVRVKLADGTAGWLAASVVEPVAASAR